MKRLLLLLIAGLTTISAHGTVKTSREVFDRLIQIQQVIPELAFSPLKEHLTAAFINDFKQTYEQSSYALRTCTPFLTRLSGGGITPSSYEITPEAEKELLDNVAMLYDLADTSTDRFLLSLLTLGIAEGPVDKYRSTSDLIAQNNSATKLLLAGLPEKQKTAYLFNLANKFYDFCFAPGNFTRFQSMVFEEQSHSFVKYIIGNTWQELAGHGWSRWHENTLKRLQQEAKAGKTIKYIAGGSDLYQLITRGVYNIINIDPQLPSQPRFYASGWDFLLEGNVGDRIVFSPQEGGIFMMRRPVKHSGKFFQAQLANKQIMKLEEVEISWDIFDASQQQIGNYTLKRRFCNQDDFKPASNEALLISFNELHFVCAPDLAEGWHLNPPAFDPSLTLHVKQLGRPIGKEEMCNLHLGAILNITDLEFVALGSCIN